VAIGRQAVAILGVVTSGLLVAGWGGESGSSAQGLASSTSSVLAGRVVPGSSLVCKLPRGSTKLPATARRGLVQHLHQYPVVRLATPTERARARRVLLQLVAAAEKGNWRDVRAAEHAGYETRTAPRRPGDRSVHYLHAERPQEPRGRSIFDFSRPKALIYANAPRQPLVLVGAMWSTRDGERGPTPAGPILRWHSHTVCARPGHRGLKPPASGMCPPGAELIQGRSEMLHVWFTGELRSAFAIRAPEPELCAAGLLPKSHCRER
jgi:hypothetical protein